MHMRANADVIVVGAGLAGLAAAWELERKGLEVTLLEASDQVGGRVATDYVGGVALDRGFQVYNTAYPDGARLLDHQALDLLRFTPAVAVYFDRSLHYLANPLRDPLGALRSLLSPLVPMRQLLGLAMLSAPDVLASPARRMDREHDRSTAAELAAAGLSGPMTERLLRPFLSGVLLDGDLETSARFFHLVWRTFVMGQATLPSLGMRSIPAFLAGLLKSTQVALGSPVRSIDAGSVTLSDNHRLRAKAVVLATGGPEAARLTRRLRAVPGRPVTTFYHLAPSAPLEQPVLVLDGEEGLVVNTVVLSNLGGSYRPTSGALVSTSTLGIADDPSVETAVRCRLATLYGADTSTWQLLATYPIAYALPAFPPGSPLRRRARLEEGLYVCGDHRATPSIQGALRSGAEVAEAVVADLLGVPGGRRN